MTQDSLSADRSRHHNPIVAAALSLVAVGFVMMASAMTSNPSVAVTNPVEHEGNATTCPQVGFSAATFFGGSNHIGSYPEALFDYRIDDHQVGIAVDASDSDVGKYVNLSDVSNTITIHAVIVKGGDGYNQYSPYVPNMHAPLVGSSDVASASVNVPDISHWFLCYTTNPTTTTTGVATTTTVAATTTTAAATTTTAAATTTTVAATTTSAAATTTTSGATTTSVASATPTTSGATTTSVASAAPTTTAVTSTDDPLIHTTVPLVAEQGPLPATGGSDVILVVVGSILISAGTVLLASRTPRQVR